MHDRILDAVLPKLQERLPELVRRQRIPGVAAGIVRGQELAWSAGYGFADIASKRPVDAQALFRVGSITKTFTATAIMQLRDDGKLRLDDPMVRFIPEFSAVRCRFGTVEDVTLRRLLTHRSGLAGEPPLNHWETLSFPTIEDILAALPDTQLVIEPDSAFKYSNLAFALLGEVVARVSGQPYTRYVTDQILVPLGMGTSAFELTDALRPQMATGYDPSTFEDVPPLSKHPIIHGMASAGQLYSSVHDLARWISLQFRTDAPEREGTQVLRGRSLWEMHQPNYMEPNWQAGYALAWMGSRYGENVYLGHSGGIHGFITQILFHVPSRTGVVVLTNSGGGMPGVIAVEILEQIMAAEREGKQTVLEPPVATPEDWNALLGIYRAGIGGTVQIECRAGSLIVAWPQVAGQPPVPPIHLIPTEQRLEFLVEDGRYAGELLTFRKTDAGTISSFRVSGFVFSRLAGVNP